MATSVERVERTGPSGSASVDWNTQAIRLSPPSTSSSKTTSAWLSPAWGRAPSSLSILTTRAGRISFVPSGSGSPVSGDTIGTTTGGAVVVGATLVVGSVLVAGAGVVVGVA